jgi:hypothetical protein
MLVLVSFLAKATAAVTPRQQTEFSESPFSQNARAIESILVVVVVLFE